MNDQDVLNEAVRLLGSVPESSTFRHDIPGNLEWFGAVLNLAKASKDIALHTEAHTLISNLNRTPIVDRNPRSRLIIVLQQIKREFEIKCGYSIPRNYIALSETDRNSARSGLSDLETAVEADNEINNEDREIALSEIAIFEASLGVARLSPDIIARFVNGFLRGAIILSASSMLKQAAAKLADLLLRVLGWAS